MSRTRRVAKFQRVVCVDMMPHLVSSGGKLANKCIDVSQIPDLCAHVDMMELEDCEDSMLATWQIGCKAFDRHLRRRRGS